MKVGLQHIRGDGSGLEVLNKIQHELLELCSAKNLLVLLDDSLAYKNLLYLVLVFEVPTSDDILMDLGKAFPQ